MLPTVTRDVTHSNTTKKTDIQRLNTKTEFNPPLQQPSPLATVVPGVLNSNTETVEEQNINPTNTEDMSVSKVLSFFDDNAIIKFNKLDNLSKEHLLDKFKLSYEEQLQFNLRAKNKFKSIVYSIGDQSKENEGVTTPIKNKIAINDSIGVIEEPTTVQVLRSSNDDSDFRTKGMEIINNSYGMFELVDNF